ncbi:DUF642 domain-containing protein [Tropicibacter naphthalenivorans]|uniref:Uncharacterized protein n=1 Tax=Tropicibacter naphthalenivorans TaxID=441103 RepID=A0A0P1G587_9RHOB|nr:DUF642 domain-containing protein [Tropicibacter naphthalenivorans]CUH76861.1 hypothetical protein TRN7648_01163 [Tropicibacter naphthalenivorans]SMC62609.1 Protein of unknown function [Tropicibacter naphthalenivorans]
MSTGQNTEILLGCDPQVRVVVIEDAGALVMQVFAEDPAAVDMDALFFNLTDDAVATNINVWPVVNDGQNITGFDVAVGQLASMDSGVQIQEAYDVRVQFGEFPDTSWGDIDQAGFTLWVEGDAPLTADSIDLTNMTCVVNSDGSDNTGLALTGGLGNTGDDTTMIYETSTVLTEDFNGGSHCATGSNTVTHNDWAQTWGGELMTSGWHDGAVQLAPVESDGAVTLSFDIRAENAWAFESSGAGADRLDVQVRLDNGDWVTLDTFIVNEHTDTFTGSETGQTFGCQSTTLTYSGGVLDGVTGTAEFRIVSDITACDEKIYIDDVQITATEAIEVSPEGTVAVAEDDFEGIHYANDSDLVDYTHDWDIQNGELQTDGRDDGQIWFETVDVDGDAAISIDARAPHTEYFEDGGCYGDSLDVWALVDNYNWVHLDTFVVNAEGTALVGSNTGQEITAESDTLTWTAGLEDADSVMLYMDSKISGAEEEIFFDNLTISEAVDLPLDGDDILTNGSFESGVAAGHVNMNASVEGWQSDTGIEGWGTGFEHQAASEGQSFIELDRNADAHQVDNIYQDVQTEEGETYQLSLDVAQRFHGETDSVEIYWNNELVDTVSPDGEDWETFTVDVTGTGGLDRLEFRELASENDSTGPLLDNVSLVGGSDAGDATCGQYEVTYDELVNKQLTDEEIDALLGNTDDEEEADLVDAAFP